VYGYFLVPKTLTKRAQNMLNRREFLVTAAAVPLASSFAIRIAAAAAAVPEVPPFDPSRVKPSDFSDADLDMPYNITYLPRIANSIEAEGPDRGFINISVWRGTAQLHPYNARIMESILTLAWFYATPRKWNQYYASKALRARLELALEYWCNLQSPDGKFSEYGPQQWNLAATAFAVKFISEALRLLKSGPPITPALHARAIGSLSGTPAPYGPGSACLDRRTLPGIAGSRPHSRLLSRPRCIGAIRREDAGRLVLSLVSPPLPRGQTVLAALRLVSPPQPVCGSRLLPG
jgi:hypothetical protein